MVNLKEISAIKDAQNTVNTLLRISEKLNSTLDVDLIMDILTEEAIKFINAESGFSGLRTTEGMMCKKIYNKGEVEIFEYFWTPGIGIPGKSLRIAILGSIFVRSTNCFPLVARIAAKLYSNFTPAFANGG